MTGRPWGFQLAFRPDGALLVLQRIDRMEHPRNAAEQEVRHEVFPKQRLRRTPPRQVVHGQRKSLATTYSPTVKRQYHRRGRA